VHCNNISSLSSLHQVGSNFCQGLVVHSHCPGFGRRMSAASCVKMEILLDMIRCLVAHLEKVFLFVSLDAWEGFLDLWCWSQIPNQISTLLTLDPTHPCIEIAAISDQGHWFWFVSLKCSSETDCKPHEFLLLQLGGQSNHNIHRDVCCNLANALETQSEMIEIVVHLVVQQIYLGLK
jgi:hypothetical protein